MSGSAANSMQCDCRVADTSLRPFVASFGQRRGDLRALARTVRLPARPDQLIEIYLADRYGVSRDGRVACPSPRAAVIGPQSRPGLALTMSGEIDVFTIRLQPTGMYRLFGVAMADLVDDGVAITDLLGDRGRTLHDAVAGAQGFAGRVAAAERWLTGAAQHARAPTAIDRAARLLLRCAGTARINALAARSDLSLRQFERRFTEAVGMTPKRYGRTARLARALRLRERCPELGWAGIAATAGYADQAHMIRDCAALAGAPPDRFAPLTGG